MKFNPEDESLTGPRCRNCHKGASGCGACHNTSPTGVNSSAVNAADLAADNTRTDISHLFAIMFNMIGDPNFADPATVSSFKAYTQYKKQTTSSGLSNEIEKLFEDVDGKVHSTKNSRTVDWTNTWRTLDGASASCSDDGFSFPHRTLGWKMLKDDLFGLDFDGSVISVGETRTYNGVDTNGDGEALKAHDLDSVCLDCHNPTIWNDGQVQTADGHVDEVVGDMLGRDTKTNDNHNDELLTRGLP